MKWFKHDVDASNDSRIRKLKLKFGMEGYGIYFNTLELITRNVEKDVEHFGFLPEEWDEEALAIEFGQTSNSVRTIFDYMCEIGLFEKKDGKLYNGKLRKRCDDYTTRLLRKENLTENLGTNFEHTSNNVRTKYGDVRTMSVNVPYRSRSRSRDRIDKEETNKEEIIPFKKKYSSVSDLTEIDFEEIAVKYKVPQPFVIKKYDDMVNWHESTGKIKKNWRATLMNWVSKDAEQIRKEAVNANSKHGIDARELG